MKKPVIALTPSHNLKNGRMFVFPTYVRALEAAGATCFILPLGASDEDIKQLLSICQGVLFTGGPDIHPFLLGEETLAQCGEVSTARDQLELSLLSSAMELKKPILGVCRGAQLINVGLGGTLYQDLGTQFSAGKSAIAHSQPFPPEVPSHHVNVKKDSMLAKITGVDTSDNPQFQVNSLHHQAIWKLAPALSACAHSSDGLIEAVEMTDYPFLLAVQWHPEYLFSTRSEAMAIFQAFVQSCQQ